MSVLSDDARALIGGWWLISHTTTVEIGGSLAQSVLSGRGRSAVEELIAAGLVTAEPVREDGRMLYRGTDALADIKKPSAKEMDAIGGWSPTMPNPEARL